MNFRREHKSRKKKKKKKNNKKVEVKEEDEENEEMIVKQNPYLQLGYGINAHIDTLANLSCFFLTLTIASIPLYIFYYGNQVKALATTEKNPFA